MEFISAEEFLKQDKEVQKIFIDWWKPSIGDLFNDIIDSGIIRTVSYYDKKSKNIVPFSKEYTSHIKDCIPLFIEGQLRKFIEEKSECIVSATCEDYENTYGYKIIHGFDDYDHKENADLLQAYWEAAIDIAKNYLF